MITYSTNFMGPIATRWYEENNIPFTWITTESGKRYKKYQEWAGGRIDIYGLSEEDFYTGKTEYSLPVMRAVDFNAFSRWLREMQTEELWSFEKLVDRFEFWYGQEIRWWNNDRTEV